MKSGVCFLASILLGVGPASARLGESPDECEKRYGRATATALNLGEELKEDGAGWKASTYVTRGLEIQVIFDDGKAVMVRYANQPMFSMGSAPSSTVNLSAGEIDQLKKANAEGAVWKPYSVRVLTKVAPGMKVWRTGDSDVFAGYNRESRQLFVCTSEFWDLVLERVRDRYEAGVDKRLEGL